jgi:hypothetical protein
MKTATVQKAFTHTLQSTLQIMLLINTEYCSKGKENKVILNMVPPSSWYKSAKLGNWLVTQKQRKINGSQSLGWRNEDGVHMGEWEMKSLKRAATPQKEEGKINP